MWFAQTADPTLYTVQTTTVSTGNSAAMGILWFLYVAVIVLLVVAYWKIFVKAGEAGWKSLIPFYNTYTLFRIAGRNGWGFLLLLIPVINIVVLLMISIDLAKHFGKSTVFGVVGLWIFSVIGYLMLGFDKSTYVGEKHA
jgi:hypothetical protein